MLVNLSLSNGLNYLTQLVESADTINVWNVIASTSKNSVIPEWKGRGSYVNTVFLLDYIYRDIYRIYIRANRVLLT